MAAFSPYADIPPIIQWVGIHHHFDCGHPPNEKSGTQKVDVHDW